MKTSKVLKWVSGGVEAFLAIPIIGGSIILSLLWTPLLAMLILHIITLVYCKQENESTAGSIVGIVTSLIGWIPIVGWIMHVVTAVLLMLSAARKGSNTTYYQA